MKLEKNYKTLFLENNIYEVLTSKNSEKQNDIKKSFNVIHKNFLKQFGIPTNENMIHFGKSVSYNGKFDIKERIIYLFPRSLKDNNFQYFHTLIHESTHLIQDFIIKNNVSRKNINNLSYEMYKEMCIKYFNNNNIVVSGEMFENFKKFIENNKYFENDKLNLIYKDLIIYSDMAISYNNNICEIMANEFALKELKETFFDKKYELNRDHINEIKKCIDRDFKKLEKINPNTKSISLVIQSITNTFKNFSLNNHLMSADLYDVKPDIIKCMKDAQDYLDATILDIDAVNYFSKDENELEQQMAELFNSIDTTIPNFETKNIEENDDHDEP